MMLYALFHCGKITLTDSIVFELAWFLMQLSPLPQDLQHDNLKKEKKKYPLAAALILKCYNYIKAILLLKSWMNRKNK